MKGYNKQVYMKVVLILLAEALAISITKFAVKYGMPIEHTTLSYIVCGALLAYIVVSTYDYIIRKGEMRAQQERQHLMDIMMLRYSHRGRDHRP
ncbi:hypothetical protein Thu_55 [Bacillus phage Thurquoise]|uniref:Uncharacterized protein n=1 Tax=Bacillus phage Deep Blue TaxID=1792245 RepID=A0A140HM25_9CAUD|nr:membrane protein [Bacillus phage Deep Blue]AMO26037.1 hypothetical protein Blue_215 [Bacillus phage Deep Blue]UXQ88915.1 hypothetical protein Thu_55 [Bacillus phage Thurquoise]